MGDKDDPRHHGEADRPGDAQIATGLLAYDTRDLRRDEIRRNKKRHGEEDDDDDDEHRRQAN